MTANGGMMSCAEEYEAFARRQCRRSGHRPADRNRPDLPDLGRDDLHVAAGPVEKPGRVADDRRHPCLPASISHFSPDHRFRSRAGTARRVWRIRAAMFESSPDLSVSTVAEIVRLALAPVFLLSGIGAFLNVLAVAPVADRRPLAGDRAAAPRQPRRRARPLDRRPQSPRPPDVADQLGDRIFRHIGNPHMLGRHPVVRGQPRPDAGSAPTIAWLFIASMLTIGAGFAIFLIETTIARARRPSPFGAAAAYGGRGRLGRLSAAGARHYRCNTHRGRPRAVPLLRRRRPDRAVQRGRARRADHRLPQRLCGLAHRQIGGGDRRGAGGRAHGCTPSGAARSATAGSSSPTSMTASSEASSSPGRTRCTSPPSS